MDYLLSQSENRAWNILKLSEVLKDPAFAALQRWLQQNNQYPNDLQTRIDQIIEQIRTST